ncbi:4308_t:CDS:2, partial [Gigaspora rosea]
KTSLLWSRRIALEKLYVAVSCLGELYVAVVVQNPEIGVLYPFSSFRAIHRCPFGIVPWRTLRCRRRSGGSELYVAVVVQYNCVVGVVISESWNRRGVLLLAFFDRFFVLFLVCDLTNTHPLIL